MDTKRSIVVRRPMPHRKYSEYTVGLRVLLAIADIVTWAYFFGIPFLPNALPHLADYSVIVNLFTEELRGGRL